MSDERRRNLMGKPSVDGYGDFGGYMFTPGPLVYENGQFRVQETWNEVNSYGSIYGTNEGSTYFGFINIGQRFDSRGSSFSESSGSINNANPLSFDGYDDWTIPTQDVFRTLIGTKEGYTRNGSTVNGNANKHYTRVLANISYADNSVTDGYIIFPDDKDITGVTLSFFDSDAYSNGAAATGLTSDDIDNYIKQGCIFLPFAGVCSYSQWFTAYYPNNGSGRGNGGYLSATSRDKSTLWHLQLFRDLSADISTDKKNSYNSVILCRQI